MIKEIIIKIAHSASFYKISYKFSWTRNNGKNKGVHSITKNSKTDFDANISHYQITRTANYYNIASTC